MKLADISQEVKSCRACPLYRRCNGPIPGVGLSTAKLMVVGPNPGWEEDRDRTSWAGQTGQFLTLILEAQGWRGAKVYYTHLVHCYPGRNVVDPPKEAQQACGIHLKRELDAVRPDLILAVGALVTRWFGVKGGIIKASGTVHQTNYGAVMPIISPGSLLTPAHKKDTPLFVTLLKSINTYFEGAAVPPAHIKSDDWLKERGYERNQLGQPR